MSHPRTQLQRIGGPDTEDNDRVRHPQTENDRNQKDTDETASWKRQDRPWFALVEFTLSVEVPRGIADERDSADRTVTPTGNKTKMNGFVEISTLLIHSAPKQKSNQWTHLSPFYTRMHGECLRYAKSTSQFHWRFLLIRDVRGFQVNPLCRHDITRSDRQIGNWYPVDVFMIVRTKWQTIYVYYTLLYNLRVWKVLLESLNVHRARCIVEDRPIYKTAVIHWHLYIRGKLVWLYILVFIWNVLAY